MPIDATWTVLLDCKRRVLSPLFVSLVRDIPMLPSHTPSSTLLQTFKCHHSPCKPQLTCFVMPEHPSSLIRSPPSPFQLKGISQRWGWLCSLCADAPWATPRLRGPIGQFNPSCLGWLSNGVDCCYPTVDKSKKTRHCRIPIVPNRHGFDSPKR